MNLSRLALIIVLLITPLIGSTQTIINIDEKFQVEELDTKILIKTDFDRKINIKNVQSQLDDFKPFTKSHKTGDNFHWITFTLQNSLNKPISLVLSYEIFADSIYTYLSFDRGLKPIDSPQSWKTPNEKRFYPHIRYPIFEINLAAKEQKRVFIKLMKKDGGILKLPFFLWEKQAFYDDYNKITLYHGFFYGWMLFVCLLSLTFYVYLKENIYLFYSLTVFFSAMGVAGISGTLNQLFGWLPSSMSGAPGLIFFNSFYIFFNFKFILIYLDVKKDAPKILINLGNYFITVGYIWLFLNLISQDFFYSPYSYIFYNSVAITFIILTILYIINGIKRDNTSAKFYLIAILPLFIIGFIYLLYGLGVANFQHTFVIIYRLTILFEIFVLSLGLGYRYFLIKKEKKNLESELIQAQYLIIASQETERQRIAQDLHDEVGNSLAALKNYVSQTNLELGSKINKIAQDVRNISHNLASIDFEKTTLSVTFQNLINRHNEADNIDYELIEVGKPQKLAAERELVIYRIVCELLNNIQKHSKAQKATLQLIYEDNTLTVTVEDNGIGIKNKSNMIEGIGLKHIQTRVAYLNGKLTIDDDGKGTIIVLDIPIFQTIKT